MKKFFVFLTAALCLLLSSCGSSAPDSAGSAPAADAPEAAVSEQTASAEDADAMDAPLEVWLFKKLDDSSIMAACRSDQNGMDRMGGDYFVVHVGDAEIYNMDGEKITLDQIARGSDLRIEWPGMVMESYPAQISAETVRVISEDFVDQIPPEDNIPALFDGPKWWEEEPVRDIPALNISYDAPEFTVTMVVPHRYGSWNYTESGSAEEEGISAGANNTILDGQHPSQWGLGEDQTIKRFVTDKVTLSTSPQADEITVTAYTGDPKLLDQEVPVELDEQGTLELLDGTCIYVVTAVWNGDAYQGSATYGFLVTD